MTNKEKDFYRLLNEEFSVISEMLRSPNKTFYVYMDDHTIAIRNLKVISVKALDGSNFLSQDDFKYFKNIQENDFAFDVKERNAKIRNFLNTHNK